MHVFIEKNLTLILINSNLRLHKLKKKKKNQIGLHKLVIRFNHVHFNFLNGEAKVNNNAPQFIQRLRFRQ